MNLLTMSNVLAWSAQVAVIAAAALLAVRILRFDAPGARYLFLRTVLAVCLLLPFAQPVRPAGGSAGAGSPSLFDAPARLAAESRVAENANSVTAFGVPGIPAAAGVLAAVVLCGAGARLLWMAMGIVRLRELRRLGEIAPANNDHDELQRMIGTSATIRYVRGLGQPVTFGFRRPLVLLPDPVTEQARSLERAVLAHELWHVRRRDWMLTVVEELIRAIFWFHPGVWALVSGIQAAREEVVDELAILSTGSRRNYVDALLAYADRAPLLAATAFARRKHLIRRVFLISKEAFMSPRRVVLSGGALVAVLLSTGWYSTHAFPLRQEAAVAGHAGAVWGGPGPVEQRAKPITPENPIPRRTYFVPADYPPEAEGIRLRGMVAVRVTLDESGAIAETRLSGLSLNLGDAGRVSMTNVAGSHPENVRMTATGTSATEVPAEQFRTAIQKTVDAAVRAVQHWQYAAPADGPIAFTVSVPVGLPAPRTTPPPPPPPPPGSLEADGAIRVGGSIKPPTKLQNVNPIYPPDALAARVQGVVILETRIEPDGTVSQARVLRSIPPLDDAAIDAVRQWRFTPTLLNGEPVPVIMTVTVNFRLD